MVLLGFRSVDKGFLQESAVHPVARYKSTTKNLEILLDILCFRSKMSGLPRYFDIWSSDQNQSKGLD
jgi:hypothetical protein